MNRTMISVASAATLLVCASGATAQATPDTGLMQPAMMSCEQLSAEVVRVNGLIAAANGQAASADGQARGAELGASVAINGALYSGALGRVPGLGMFANQAANLAKQRAANKAAQAAQTIRDAEMRRAVVEGIYQAKTCGQATAVSSATTIPVAATTVAPKR
jgi:hypothetical protein